MHEYHLYRTEGGSFFFTLRAPDGHVLLQSGPYETHSGAEDGILDCRAASRYDERYRRDDKPRRACRFRLLCLNGPGEVGTSPPFKTNTRRDLGIIDCKAYGPTAGVVDDTTAALATKA
ncbi:MAG: DUF1508 domain-containing protein [Phycisphaerales bacterium]|nr:DUF1508 domain-containing protein [Phycisphaerales bacterium]